VADYSQLPDGLPVPTDDGGADDLPGRAMPDLSLPSTGGEPVSLNRLGAGRAIVYVYPLTGRPGHDLPAGWDDIPGARGCTTEACDFRDDVIEDGMIEHAFYPIFPPNQHAREVLSWLRSSRSRPQTGAW
jgi:peroxiredoxin